MSSQLPFSKILIANRGEIACRVIKTAKKLGIATVAVYSEADKNSLHTSLADEAVAIGPAPSAQSYLVADQIVKACLDTGAQAVHPGYGFLSENAAFAEKLTSAGITFIGPNVHAIRSMGDKITSKRLAQEAGVNTIPGFTDVIRDADHAVAIAEKIGYPIMLKATAGGGGKGMRVAWNAESCREGFERAQGEAAAAFGDDRIFLERLIEEPRHIEIQVMADKYGHVIHLGERECSLQRRHQKVIEESPSPFLDEATRQAMGSQAVALAKAVDYDSAGTVEFIVDSQRNFYFLEMNTRLQVEHPVTEFVTGLDLVELMIRSAAGEPLRLKQADVRRDGWAIEARICAEDPFRNFLPSVGRLVRYTPPSESASVRIDTGVYEGDEVSIHYDPMIAKLITHGASRDHAILHMRRALNRFHLSGVSHNIGFLAALIEHDRFREARLTTNLIAEEFPDGFHANDAVHDEPELLIAVAGFIHRRYMERAASISGQMPGYEKEVQRRWVVVMRDVHYSIEVSPWEGHGKGGNSDAGGEKQTGCGYDISFDGRNYRVISDWEFGQPMFDGTVNGVEVCLLLERRNIFYRVIHWGAQIDIMVLTAKAAELLSCIPKKSPPDMSRFLLSPMPGLLSQLLVDSGHEVKRGQDLAVVEAMKMENVLRAERDGQVAHLLASVGDSLSVDQPILEFVAG